MENRTERKGADRYRVQKRIVFARVANVTNSYSIQTLVCNLVASFCFIVLYRLQ